ncbi:glycosyltransferase [Chryseobacterium sp. WG14]|uniref:glycosyltransferase n=1 Tax=unclassified Chryseobacterium TaxID=2593645 RepID=UPI001D2DB518|nr:MULTISPECIES: glycosyltransferase [unclassified Chryseobacterium]MCQ9641713.1 glycosyltransferase [Chryseobacterium sp. WG14]CAH0274498.1 N-acetyl-alpha-D-glucosaminyl L-malate synthase [Chryseobacterium sp. Bi04]
MRILQVIDCLSIGGAEKNLVEIVPLLVERGFVVDVLLLNGNKTPFYYQLEKLGITKIFSLGDSYYNPKYIFKMIPYLKKYDLVHVHLFPAQYFVVLAKILSFSKIKLLFTEHSTGNKRLNNPKLRFAEKFIDKYYSKIICITPQVKNILIEKLRIDHSKLLVIENGVNLEKIKNAIKYDKLNFGYNQTDVLLIMVAAFRNEKDQDTVIKTMQKLPENYKLILVGEGARKEQLKILMNSLHLQERVNFLGIREDVYSLLKMSDIAILSSHWEGFGLAAVEAMAAGIPIIGSNVSGLAEVIGTPDLLFEREDEVDLAKKIEKLITDKIHYLKMQKYALERSKNYDVQIMVSNHYSLYKNLINE